MVIEAPPRNTPSTDPAESKGQYAAGTANPDTDKPLPPPSTATDPDTPTEPDTPAASTVNTNTESNNKPAPEAAKVTTNCVSDTRVTPATDTPATPDTDTCDVVTVDANVSPLRVSETFAPPRSDSCSGSGRSLNTSCTCDASNAYPYTRTSSIKPP